MHTFFTFAAVAVLAFIGVAAPAPAFADGVRFGDGVHGARTVVGFVGCDMHAAAGPEVVLIQVARDSLVGGNPDRFIGKRCATALVVLQKKFGMVLGASRVVPMPPGSAAGDDNPDCLIWDIQDSDGD